MIGNKKKGVAPCEENGKIWALKSLVASRNLTSGKKLTNNDILSKRPGNGLPPLEKCNLIDKTLKKSMSEGDFFTFDNLK